VIVVPDAGPLIYLAGANRLDVLARLYDRVVVPRVVYKEIVVAGAGLMGSAAVADAKWI
jgi:predicted nucleic acid-binding protein